MGRGRAPAMSTEQARTRSAATAIMALGSSPVATRCVVAKKGTSDTGRPKETIICLQPPYPPRVTGYWHKKNVETRSTPELEGLDQTTVPAPHPDLAPYWGNVDDRSNIYLFDRPTPNYVPIKLPGLVKFTDCLMVSSYLINCMIYFIK